MNFDEVFDVRSLDDYQLGHLQFVLNSPSYADIFAPYIRKVRNSMNAMLLDPSQERKDRYSNDFLTGGIIFADGLLKLFEKLIEETTIDNLVESQAQTPEQQYETLRQAGKIRPASGLSIPMEQPYDPAEDY